jgi:hypothetical protein
MIQLLVLKLHPKLPTNKLAYLSSGKLAHVVRCNGIIRVNTGPCCPVRSPDAADDDAPTKRCDSGHHMLQRRLAVTTWPTTTGEISNS